jgi:hypothetical protein
MSQQPRTLAEFIDAVREGLVCERCGKYVGGIAQKQFLPAPYPVALDKIGVDDEAEALIGFEWHMVQLVREGVFVVRHPERDGACITFREWADDDDDEGGEDEDEDSA